ncbi:hypothetical protein [Paraburkholderia hospita]|uniref:hypothetical protein n=1 Tax=Paraburkholderia hospita TaxID=169430 RepID=UPI003ECD0772
MKKSILGALLALSAITAYAYSGHIDGDFEGWDGDKVYKLDDGHIIHQVSADYCYTYTYHPEIVIFDHYKAVVTGGSCSRPVAIEVLK